MSSENTTRYLTKTLFVKALECSTKLYYHKKPQYAVIEADDFQKALQEGGFQVGELAKCYYPEGTEIKTREHNEAVRQTNELLKQENAVIYEAAVRYDKFFIHVDIFKKEGNKIYLIEVKAKSIDPNDKEESLENKGKIGYKNAEWRDYIADAAFQTWVVEQAFPKFKVIPYLMLADKSKVATVDGLNQMFRVKKINGRMVVQRTFDKLTPDMLGNKILTEFPVREHVNKVINEGIKINPDGVKPLRDLANEYADYYINDRQYPITIQKRCKKCEFKLDDENLKKGLKSGYEECMAKSFSNFAPDKPTVMDIWNFRDANKLLDSGIYEMKGAFKYLEGKNNTATIERQLLQVRKICFEQDRKEDVKPKLFDEMNKWRFPLHFVDFEGSRAAIPFNAGTSPYEQIAFQFSCHTLYESGEIKHIEWIKREPGEFPNFEFIKALKGVLDKDNGTIFCYANYENMVLREIREQIEKIKPEAIDYKSLMNWIDMITEKGSRGMVDMCEVVRKYYYHPDMGGSNSIKDVLPAVLSASRFLKDKYSKPLNFGTNLMGKVWWKNDAVSGKAIDPYKLLRENFDDNRDVINDGGTAMTAFGKLQYSDISEKERKEIISDLLRYCELDTLAMLMLYEHWRSLRGSN